MKQEYGICTHVNMYRYFGGVSKILVPDNLKIGIIRVDWHDSEINKIYREMPEHYNTAVIPARVRHPKDKASMESTEGNISMDYYGSEKTNVFYFECTEQIHNRKVKRV